MVSFEGVSFKLVAVTIPSRPMPHPAFDGHLKCCRSPGGAFGN